MMEKLVSVVWNRNDGDGKSGRVMKMVMTVEAVRFRKMMTVIMWVK